MQHSLGIDVGGKCEVVEEEDKLLPKGEGAVYCSVKIERCGDGVSFTFDQPLIFAPFTRTTALRVAADMLTLLAENAPEKFRFPALDGMQL